MTTAVAGNITKKETGESFDISSLMILNAWSENDMVSMLLAYFPDENLSYLHNEQQDNYMAPSNEFSITKVKASYSKGRPTSVVSLGLPFDGSFFITKVENNYYSAYSGIFAGEETTALVGARRNFFMPFFVYNTNSLEHFLYNHDPSSGESLSIISQLSDMIKEPFEQILDNSILPKNLKNYPLEGAKCDIFHVF